MKQVLKSFPLINLLFILIAGVLFLVDQALGAAASGISFAMAAGGSLERNDQVVDGAGWDRKFGIAAAYAALMRQRVWISGEDGDWFLGVYNSSTAFSSNASNYNSLPLGSMVVDLQADKLYMHDAATTWKAATFS